MIKLQLFLFRVEIEIEIEIEGVNPKVYIPRCRDLVITSSEHDKSAKHIDGRFAKCGDFIKQPILSSLKIHDPTEELKAMFRSP
ncbi:hypothetical protein CASFOL_028720 [Castilleja foliolosa]|uniref:Uncharacterized protein n=1 Tax=Castilleja foliolosa TaxID=1961234 RepID=A0ABD3CCV6_9LAMI